MKRIFWSAAFFLALAASTQLVQGQDVSSAVADLNARMQMLEQQNAELRQALADGVTPRENPDQVRYASTGYDHSYIESIVEQRLAEYEAQRMADDKAAAEGEGYEIGSELSMTASWNHGVELQTKNKDFRLHVGGRTQFDAGWYDVDNNVQVDPTLQNPYEDGVDFRRARFRMDGTMYEFIDWAAEYDFVQAFRLTGADRALTAPTDLWFTFKETPYVGNVRIGNHKPAIGFEHLVSSRFLPFMERSYNQDAFYGGQYNGFQPGISIFDTYDEEWGTWNMGVYKPTDNVFAFSAHTGDYMAVSRITRLLWYVNEGRGLLHVGMSGNHQTTVGDRYIFRTRDGIRTGLATTWPVPATTGTIAGDDMEWVNAEVASVYGPWTFQSEWLVSNLHDAAPLVAGVPGPTVGDVTYHGGYCQIMYFLTGENDRYNRKTGVFDRVIPYENFFLVRDPDGNHACGMGAWQVGLRYNYLDLNDSGINGGVLHNVTAGLNWFLNPNMKVQYNYIATHRDAAGTAGDGWINGWGMRVAHDF